MSSKKQSLEINLKKFDMKSITPDSVVVMIAKRRSGKSFLVKDLLKNHKDIPIGMVISPTEEANPFYSDFMPGIFIHNKYDSELIDNFLLRQQNACEKFRENKISDPHAFLILDDCMYDNKWTKDDCMRYIFMNGRHKKILFIFTMQYPLGILPDLRTNIDYIFILRETITSNRKRLYDHYAGMFPTFDIFCQVMDSTTEDYECLVIHNSARSNKIEDQVFWYKAEQHEPFKIGAQKLWNYHQQNYDPTRDNSLINSIQQKARKNKIIANVKKYSSSTD